MGGSSRGYRPKRPAGRRGDRPPARRESAALPRAAGPGGRGGDARRAGRRAGSAGQQSDADPVGLPLLHARSARGSVVSTRPPFLSPSRGRTCWFDARYPRSGRTGRTSPVSARSRAGRITRKWPGARSFRCSARSVASRGDTAGRAALGCASTRRCGVAADADSRQVVPKEHERRSTRSLAVGRCLRVAGGIRRTAGALRR